MTRKVFRINPSLGNWEFVEKNEDMSVIMKNNYTGDVIEGDILEISSTGFYSVAITKEILKG